MWYDVSVFWEATIKHLSLLRTLSPDFTRNPRSLEFLPSGPGLISTSPPRLRTIGPQSRGPLQGPWGVFTFPCHNHNQVIVSGLGRKVHPNCPRRIDEKTKVKTGKSDKSCPFGLRRNWYSLVHRGVEFRSRVSFRDQGIFTGSTTVCLRFHSSDNDL